MEICALVQRIVDGILIPIATDIEQKTFHTVNRFSFYAGALSVPIVKDKREGFIPVAEYILEKTTKQHNDVGNLFHTWKKVTLTLVGERLKQFSMTEYTKDCPPDPTRLQKQAAEIPVRTFDDVWIERMKHRSLQIKQMVDKHQSRKLVIAQEVSLVLQCTHKNKSRSGGGFCSF